MLPAFGGIKYGVIGTVQGALSLALRRGEAPAASEVLASFTQLRSATKKAGGTAKQGVKSHPKHLGMKMFDGELVFPGMILLRQRGTKFHPGQNVGMGRDHTIFATNVGKVRVATVTQPRRKERRYINVEPLPEVLSEAATLAAGAAVTTSKRSATLQVYEKQIVEELVKRRGEVKRAMLRGTVPLEPALFFNLPTHPDGTLSWVERTRPHLDLTKVVTKDLVMAQ